MLSREREGDRQRDTGRKKDSKHTCLAKKLWKIE